MCVCVCVCACVCVCWIMHAQNIPFQTNKQYHGFSPILSMYTLAPAGLMRLKARDATPLCPRLNRFTPRARLLCVQDFFGNTWYVSDTIVNFFNYGSYLTSPLSLSPPPPSTLPHPHTISMSHWMLLAHLWSKDDTPTSPRTILTRMLLCVCTVKCTMLRRACLRTVTCTMITPR